MEFGLLGCGVTPEPLTFTDPVKKPGNGRQIIHLHGYIHRCSNEDLDERLVLTQRSYVRQLSAPRPWFDQFIDDIRFAQAIVFVGYSLADVPIAALLLSAPEIRAKTSFVVRSPPDRRYERQVSLYGTIRPIALQGLADHLRAISKTEISRQPTQFAA
ncbi:SIR2 family protein [Ensifer adhaerens]|uniref:SIR2 family protein n=1 Tax=Ensifer adhaerens TaxID=106592 RepID=UPI003CD04A47